MSKALGIVVVAVGTIRTEVLVPSMVDSQCLAIRWEIWISVAWPCRARDMDVVQPLIRVFWSLAPSQVLVVLNR